MEFPAKKKKKKKKTTAFDDLPVDIVRFHRATAFLCSRKEKQKHCHLKERKRRRKEKCIIHPQSDQISLLNAKDRRFDFDLDENEEVKESGDVSKEVVATGKYPWSGTDRDYTYEELLGK